VIHDSFICDTWLIHMWYMTESWVMYHIWMSHDSFICDTWCITYEWVMFMRHFRSVHIRLIRRDYVKHDSFIFVTCLNPMCDMTQSCSWDTSNNSTYDYCCTIMSHVVYEWDMSCRKICRIWMGHVTYEWVMSHMNESCHIWMSHVTYEWVMSHMNESCYTWMSHVS